MNMDRYKKTIKRRIYLLSIPMILAVAFGIYNVFFGTAEIKNNYIFGFQNGLFFSLGLFSLVIVIRFRALLKDDDKLILQFNKENVEEMDLKKLHAEHEAFQVL